MDCLCVFTVGIHETVQCPLITSTHTLSPASLIPKLIAMIRRGEGEEVCGKEAGEGERSGEEEEKERRGTLCVNYPYTHSPRLY